MKDSGSNQVIMIASRRRLGTAAGAVVVALVALLALWLVSRPRLGQSQEGCLAQGCHPNKGQGPGVHPALAQGCEACHEVKGPHDKDKSQVKLTVAGNGLCFQCHDNPATNKAKPHAHPALEQGCTSCHDPHRSSNKHLLKQPQPDLCYQCHDSKTAKPHVHSAISQLSCTGCHQPHAAEQKYLLKQLPPQLCYDCHDRKDQGPVVHPALAQGCEVCHDFHSSDQPKLLKAPVRELCGQCHQPAQGRSVHSALKQGLCLGCHDPHQSKNRRLIKGAKLEDDCLACHPNKKPTKAIVHPALTDAGCPVCHAPHASEQKFQLTKKQPDLCYDCHDRKDTAPVVHPPLMYGRCSGCHEPHQSDVKGMLRGKDLADTCSGCHFNDIAGRKVIHPPVKEGACRDCHLPHSSKNDRLLVANKVELCFTCHDAFPKVKHPHPALERNGCPTCHDPHATDNPRMLIKPMNDLCVTCHPEQKTGRHFASGFSQTEHPVSGVPDRSRPGRTMDCTSCHNPHGSDNIRMFYKEPTKEEVCRKCHQGK